MTDNIKKEADGNTSADYYTNFQLVRCSDYFITFVKKKSLVFMENICGKISKMHLINEIKEKKVRIRRDVNK